MSSNRSQAYQLKAIRFQNLARKILLQNENGPCPLIAAANALLLRGVITLDPVCVRNGVASTDDVVNMLANRALLAGSNRTKGTTHDQTMTTTTPPSGSDNDTSSSHDNHAEYHLNEVLSLLPNLQHGMDVNPKFTSGPTGVEYTTNLAAFDLLGVDLVHGWLLDEQDVEASAVVGSKTYNELIETVIQGNEAKEALMKLDSKLREKESVLEKHDVEVSESQGTSEMGGDDVIVSEIIDASSIKGEESVTSNIQQEQPKDSLKENGKVDVPNEAVDEKISNEPCALEEKNSQSIITQEQSSSDEMPSKESLPAMPDQKVEENENSVAKTEQQHEILTVDERTALQEEISKTREEISKLSFHVTKSQVANAFLTSSSHQLTHHGLEQLHKHTGDGSLSVFFRNNHFATLTKHNGILYLLATDLGYANTPEIVWEKLDDIDGDTEYANEFFARPAPRTELTPASGPTIAPELLLAQRSQAETDYQLALAMSAGTATAGRTDDEEGRLMEAAKELSLRTYHGEEGAEVSVGTNGGNATSTCTSQVDSDMEIAMAYQHAQRQSEHDSEQLARQLQELEYARQCPAGNARATRPPRAAVEETTSSCTIS